MKKAVSILRKSFLWMWLIAILLCLLYFFTHRDEFTTAAIASFFQKFNSYMLFAYFIVSIVRGFTLIPSTPFVLAGGILFPGQEWLVLLISLMGIACSATLIYHFSHLMRLGAVIEKRYPQEKLKQKMESRNGVFFVLLWSFFPVVPTDAICYAAGAAKMRFISYIFAVLLGELIICSVYVFTGSGLINLFI
jgi:uncharacterized membrane protein YdjX (TVP38/TMEM64 family)